MNTISSLFYYFFTPNPGSQFKFYIPMIVLITLLIAGGIVFSIIYKRKKRKDLTFKKLFQKTATRLVLLGILFLILTVVRYESIPYFSMRIWLYLSFLLLAIFFYLTIRTFKIKYPKEKENLEKRTHNMKKRETENRYLPNKKK